MGEGNFYEKIQDGYSIANQRNNAKLVDDGTYNIYQNVNGADDSDKANENQAGDLVNEANSNKINEKASKEKKVKEKKVKENKQKKKFSILFIVIPIIVCILAGLGVAGVYGYNLYQEKVATDKMLAEYSELIKTSKEQISDGEYEDAIETLEEAIEINDIDTEEACKYMGRAYIRLAGENYADANSYYNMRDYDMALECCDNAEEYLKKADKYWKDEGFKFSDVAFYDCKSIDDAQLLIKNRRSEIEAVEGYKKLAIELLTKAETLLSEKDYAHMNELDTSDESDKVYQYYINTTNDDYVIMYTGDEGLTITTGEYDGYGVAIYQVSNGFYYYAGSIEDGYPDGEGVAYISSSSGRYKVMEGKWKDGLQNGNMKFTTHNSLYDCIYTGKADSYGFEGEVSIERIPVSGGKTAYGTVEYEDGVLQYKDAEWFEELVEEYELDEDEVYFWDDYYAGVYVDKKGKYMEMIEGYALDTLDFSLY